MHREPNVGFDPGSPGSRLGQRQVLNHCATQAALVRISFLSACCVSGSLPSAPHSLAPVFLVKPLRGSYQFAESSPCSMGWTLSSLPFHG